MSINFVSINGKLTRDPFTKTLPSGAKIASFSLANNDSYVDKSGERQERVSYIDCDVFYRDDSAISVLKKGAEILVQGKLEQQRWKDSKTQENRQKVLVKVDQFYSRAHLEDATDEAPNKEPPAVGEKVVIKKVKEEEIPF